MALIFSHPTTPGLHPHRTPVDQRKRALAASAAILVFFVLVAASCPPQRVAYDSIDIATAVVQTSVTVFKDLKAQGKFTDADEVKVRAAYAKFQVSAEAARVLAQNASQKETALKQINDAAAEIMKLLGTFGIGVK